MPIDDELLQPSRPWWIEGIQSNDPNTKDALCGACRHINFSWLLWNDLPETDSDEEGKIRLGRLEDILLKRSCPFCRLVIQTILAGLQVVNPVAAFAENTLTTIYCEIHSGLVFRGLKQGETYQISIWTVDEAGFFIDGTQSVDFSIQLLYDHASPEFPPPNLGRRVKDCWMDSNLVKDWLHLCEAKHTHLDDTKEAAIQLPANFRVIDVQRQCLIPAPKNCRYVALSYLWGRAKVFRALRKDYAQLTKDASLSSNNEDLPRTIRDAISLVSNIGERYVWVDSLCIIQDDDEDKAQQILSMGAVYSSAILTIVAGSGDDANGGLSGVHLKQRKPFQHVETVQGLKLVNVMPELWKAMNDCPWATRGWTYQERKLSNRLLVFTEHQVYFNCQHATYREDQHLEIEDLPHNLLMWHKSERDHRLFLHKKTNFEVYVREVRQYSSRFISYDSDALNAFAGISQLLEISFRGHFIFGIPETAFDAGLLWYPTTRLKRRLDPETGAALFPSWSWAGWAGSVTYDDDNLCVTTLSRIRWLDAPNKEERRSFRDEKEANAHQDGSECKRWERRTDFGDHLVTYVYFIEEGEPDVWFSHPILPPKAESQETVPKVYSPWHLHFTAQSAHFRINWTHNNAASFNGGHCKGGTHNVCRLAVFDQNQHVVGTVHVSGDVAQRLDAMYEFVALSRTTLTNDDGDTAFLDGTFQLPHSEDDKDVVSWAEADIQRFSGSSSSITEVRHPHAFDDRVFDAKKPWCLYNVLLIEWGNGVASRLGIGKIYINAFYRALPVEKEFILG